MDNTDKLLLNLIQTDFPLTRDPFIVLADKLGVSEGEVIDRLRQLKEQRIIRQISAVFDSSALGYQSTLAAFSVPGDRVEQVKEIINAHPGVSHNYERNHVYNLWFTITIPKDVSLDTEVDRLVVRTKPQAVMILPAIRLFKIGVAFDMTGGESAGLSLPVTRQDDVELDEQDIKAVKALQHDLPIIKHPFAALAQNKGLGEDDIIARATKFLETGVMRRYAAVLRHREVGFTANALAVWNVPEDIVEQVGQTMAIHPAVSHCYQRPTYPDWPYSIFTMIHGRTPEDCENTARTLAEAAGVNDYLLLFSTREFKKTRVLYYEQEEK